MSLMSFLYKVWIYILYLLKIMTDSIHGCIQQFINFNFSAKIRFSTDSLILPLFYTYYLFYCIFVYSLIFLMWSYILLRIHQFLKEIFHISCISVINLAQWYCCRLDIILLRFRALVGTVFYFFFKNQNN